MSELILRPSSLKPGRPWALQLRYHESCGETEYYTIARVTEETAQEIIKAGAAYWLFGEPDLTSRAALASTKGQSDE